MGNSCTTSDSMDPEVRVCSSEEVEEGGMVQVEFKGMKIIILRDGGSVRGFSGTCTHYGAPLVKGVLGSNKIICPFHGACFNATTGDIEDFPGLGSLVCFRVEEKDGGIYVKGAGSSTGSRERYLGARTISSDRTVVVVGGGAAGHTAIETFRAEGFGGKILLLSSERILPYDRPKLSKKLDAKPSEIQLRNEEWYREAGVEVRLGEEVTEIIPEEKSVITSTGERIQYDDLLLATGGTPRVLEVEGAELEGVCTLRTPSDANYISERAAGKNVVIVGGSFIGMEVAAAIVGSCKKVTVIDRNPVSFQSTLGSEIGQILAELHREKGVNFEMEETVAKVLGTDGRVSGVVLGSGKELEADLVLVGVGVVPNTNFLKNIPDITDSRGIIPVNEFMETKVEKIWAAGDIVSFPLITYNREQVSIGHWGLAMYLGKIAALNIMGQGEPARTVPFFWTVQYGKSVRFAGIMNGCESVRVESENGSFLATFSCKGTVRGVASMGRDPVPAYFTKLILDGKVLREEDAVHCLTTMNI